MAQRKPLVNGAGLITEMSAQDFNDTFVAGWTAAVVALSQTVEERAVNADWFSTSGYSQILNKPNLNYHEYLSAASAQPLYIKLAMLPASATSSYEQLHINGVSNTGWGSVNNVPFDLVLGNREAGPGEVYYVYTANGLPLEGTRIVAYKTSDDIVTVWVLMTASMYAVLSFSMQAFGNGVQTWGQGDAPQQSTVPDGTLVFDSANIAVYKPLYYKDSVGFTFNEAVVTGSKDAGLSYNSLSGSLPDGTLPSVNVGYEQQRLRVNYVPDLAHPGAFVWVTSAGANSSLYKEGYRMSLQVVDSSNSSAFSGPLTVIGGDGSMSVAGALNAGPIGASGQGVGAHKFYRDSAAGGEILQIGATSSSLPTVGVNAATTGGGWAAAESVLYVSSRSTTGRSANMAGTVNTSGSDYAEYMHKCEGCGTIQKGDVVGINSNGQLTQVYDEAISFVIKTTNPSFVGGDTWDAGITKPLTPHRTAPIYKTIVDEPEVPYIAPDALGSGQAYAAAKTHQELVSAGDSDATWLAKQQAYETALALYTQEFEALRERVDRIAFCGQVPINISGQSAVVGQYALPIKNGEFISTALINKDELTFAQYMQAVGRVVAIHEDGRPIVIVKTV